MTYKPLTEDRGEELLTLYLADFHARTLAQPERVQELTANDPQCGSTWQGSLAKYDQSTSMWKTAQCSLLEDSMSFSLTLLRWGLMQDGALYPQQTLVQTIKGKESGYWPTPSTRDHKGGYIGGRIRNGKISWDTLDVAVQHTDNQNKDGGQLNPTWVEWLMGWPLGWTDLKPLEMDKYHKWRQKHFKFSLNEAA
jgi:hypothetical protein